MDALATSVRFLVAVFLFFFAETEGIADGLVEGDVKSTDKIDSEIANFLKVTWIVFYIVHISLEGKIDGYWCTSTFHSNNVDTPL